MRPEALALEAALTAIYVHYKDNSPDIVICSDPAATLSALEKGPIKQKHPVCDRIWGPLRDICKRSPATRIHLQFVYAHCGVVDNEIADFEATEILRKLSARIVHPANRYLVWTSLKSRLP